MKEPSSQKCFDNQPPHGVLEAFKIIITNRKKNLKDRKRHEYQLLTLEQRGFLYTFQRFVKTVCTTLVLESQT